MMNMINIKVLYRSCIFGAGIGIIIVFFLTFPQQEANTKVHYRVIRVENGWGYELYCHDRIIIHQEIIPAISGNKPFSSRRDARQTGNLALHKLNTGNIPFITRQELDSLKIYYQETGYEY